MLEKARAGLRRCLVKGIFFLRYLGVLEYTVFCVLGFLAAAAPMYIDSAEMQFTLGFVLRFIVTFALSVVAYSLFCFFCTRKKRLGSALREPKRRFDINRGSRSILLIAALMLVLWAPYGICLYPGISFFDTAFQLVQFFGNPSFGFFPMHEGFSYTDHHPVFDTLLFGGFVKVGTLLLSANAGMFLYLIAQAILTALSFSYAIAYMRTVLGVSRGACFASVAFLSLCPIVPVFIFSMTKDSLFSWLYVCFLVQIIEIVRTRGEALTHLKFFAAVLMVALFLGLTKKTGVYVCLLTVAALCFFAKQYWKRLVSVALVPLIVTAVILPMVVFPVLNVSPGSKVELLGFFYQQTARFVVDYPDDVTQKEKEAISGVLDYENLAERYSPGITNTIKDVGTGANHWPSRSQIIDYLICYLFEGLRHPDAYFNAVASLEAGWFDWSNSMILPTASGMPREYLSGDPDIYRPESIQMLADKLANMLAWLERFAPSSLLFKMPLYATIIPVFVTLFLRKKKSSLLSSLIPVWVSFLLLMVSPVSMAANIEAQRYLLPFVYTAPLLLMMCVAHLDEEDAPCQIEAEGSNKPRVPC